jgi:hypothetical protein
MYLTERALAIEFRLEIGIRELARRVPEVADIVKKTDKTRLEALDTLHRARFGVTPDLATDLAFIEYAAYCGMILVQPDLPQGRQHKLAAMFESMVQHFVK